jgi:hypothetical protein
MSSFLKNRPVKVFDGRCLSVWILNKISIVSALHLVTFTAIGNETDASMTCYRIFKLQLAARQLLSGHPVHYWKGRHYTAHPLQNHTCRVTLLKSTGRAAMLGQSSSLRSHWEQRHLVLPGSSSTILLITIFQILMYEICGVWSKRNMKYENGTATLVSSVCIRRKFPKINAF